MNPSSFRSVVFHPHLEGIEHPLKDGDMFPLTLTLAKAGEIKVDVMVSDN